MSATSLGASQVYPGESECNMTTLGLQGTHPDGELYATAVDLWLRSTVPMHTIVSVTVTMFAHAAKSTTVFDGDNLMGCGGYLSLPSPFGLPVSALLVVTYILRPLPTFHQPLAFPAYVPCFQSLVIVYAVERGESNREERKTEAKD